MKRRRLLVSMVVLMILLFNLSMGVLAAGDGAPTRPDSYKSINYTIKH